MFRKIFRVNHKSAVNIWVRKSFVKFGKDKSIIIEVITPEQHFFMFKERKYYNPILIDPLGIIDEFTESKSVKKYINKDGFFYFNGDKRIVNAML